MPSTARVTASAALVLAAAGAVFGAVEAESALISPAPSERAALTPDELVSPIADALAELSEDVRAFDIHISTLANPFMQGRAPGSNGSEVTKQYMEFWFEQAGLVQPFELMQDEPMATRTITKSYRQPFEMGGRSEVVAQAITAVSDSGERAGLMTPGDDFNATGLGAEGDVTGEAVFVGYSVVTDEYDSYAADPDLDLTGKVAVMLRFEPHDAEGRSKFTGGQWSPAAGFAGKLRAVAERNPAAVVIVNPPQTSDPRAGRLLPAGGGGRSAMGVPVFHMSADAGNRLVSALDSEGRSLTQMQMMADRESTIVELGGEVRLRADIETTTLIPENVAGLLQGRGDLANEYIVIGGHFDHTGDGGFGVPDTLAQVHEGADDNASGTAGVLILADRLAKTYDALPEDADARSILFIGFDAEESGLNGAYHYVANPIAPIEDHVLMLNMDMIGRIQDGGVTLHGVPSAENFEQWLEPYMDASPLTFSMPGQVSRRSDHAPFYFEGNMPVLFAICDPLHADYHTVRDEAWKINRVGAVQVIDFFENIATAVALQDDTPRYAPPAAPMRQSRVLVGVMPQASEDGGVLLAQVTESSAADEAGLRAGDRIVVWGDTEIDTVDTWRRLLTEHDPGDTVKVVVVRVGQRVTTEVTLRAR